MKLKALIMVLLVATLGLGVFAAQGQDVVELRMTWYNDGNEGDVMRAVLDKFEAAPRHSFGRAHHLWNDAVADHIVGDDLLRPRGEGCVPDHVASDEGEP